KPRKDTEVPQPGGPTETVTDEAVREEWGDRLVRAANIASSLEAKQESGGGPRCQETIGDTIAQTRFENVSKQSNDLLLAKSNTLQSDKDRLKLQELMELCTNLQKKFLDLENTKTVQAVKIKNFKKRVKKLEKKGGQELISLKGRFDDDAKMFDADKDLGGEEVIAEKVPRKDVEVSTAGDEITTASVLTTNDEITLAQVLMRINSTTPKEKGLLFKSPARHKLNDLKLKDFNKIQEMFDKALKWVNTFKDFRTELVKGRVEDNEKRAGDELAQESSKQQKYKVNAAGELQLLRDEKEEITKLKKYLFTEFKMKDLGRVKYFLRIEVLRSKQGIFMCQKRYILDLIANTDMIDCKPADTPMIENQKLYMEEKAELKEDTNGWRYGQPKIHIRLLYRSWWKSGYMEKQETKCGFPFKC
nr:putative ribonuclease H-like domain-containing protein [Tanacetum cinerariifolium]